MAAVPGIKYDDGLPAISANCFPIRTLIRENADDEGIFHSITPIFMKLKLPKP